MNTSEAKPQPNPLDEPLTRAEIHALLWVVRNVDSVALRNGPYRAGREGVSSHGALSTAANKVEHMFAKAI